jgi:hypothetical protein
LDTEISTHNNNHKSQRIHREVKRTQGNGFQTIEVTEVHVGRPNASEVIGMPLSGIIFAKPRNLKGKSATGSNTDNFITPFEMFKRTNIFAY